MSDLTPLFAKVGIFGKIQVNSAAIIYAKESELLARGILGDSVYDSIAAISGVPGGLGHSYYEKWRVRNPSALEAENIAQKSRAYYDLIRKANGYE